MPDREKLIELIGDTYIPIRRGDAEVGRYTILPCEVNAIADHLIANGVTFVTDNNVGKWIPVTERLPEEDVLVLCIGTHGGMFLGYPIWVYDGEKVAYTAVPNSRHNRYAKYWCKLPEPPKGG